MNEHNYNENNYYESENHLQDPFEDTSKHHLKGAIGALLGAALGAIPWAIAYHYGWFVGWLGLLIGFCAIKGYEILGGKPSKGKVFIVILAVIIGVILGQVAGDFLDIGQMIAEGEIEGATYGDIPYIYLFFFLYDPVDFIVASLPNLLLGFIFAGAGVWGLIKSLWQGTKNPATNDELIGETIEPTEEPLGEAQE